MFERAPTRPRRSHPPARKGARCCRPLAPRGPAAALAAEERARYDTGEPDGAPGQRGAPGPDAPAGAAPSAGTAGSSAHEVVGPAPDRGAHAHPSVEAPSGLREAVADVRAAVARLAAVELDAEDDAATSEALLELEHARHALDGQQVRVLGEFDRRDACAVDGAVTTASWLRTRARLDHGAATQRVEAARRLRRLPRLEDHLRSGEVSFAHVTQVTRAAIPRRMDAIVEVEDTLCDLALVAPPRDIGRAVARVRDLVDEDGTKATPLAQRGPDERRGLTLVPTIDGLWDVRGTLDLVTGELLASVLDACQQPDPADTPETERRSPAQRRHDGLHAALEIVASAPQTPRRHGARPHVLAMVDVATLVGLDSQAQRQPRLRYAGPIAPDQARRIAEDARLTVVQTLGPWRPIEISRTHRTLPDWLRPLLQMLHTRCRGPDCDRPAAWAEVHHITPWVQSGVTDLLDSVPVCHAHHELLEHRKWTVALDPETGRCTWTGPLGQVRWTDPLDPWEG